MHACLAVTVGRTRCLLGARCLGVACPGGRCLQDGRWALPAGRGLGAALGAALGASGRGGAASCAGRLWAMRAGRLWGALRWALLGAGLGAA